jgi:hypothetical protein
VSARLPYNTEICIGSDKEALRKIMKTTLNLNDTLLTEAKALAAQQRTSLTRLIEEGLQLRLRLRPARSKPARLPVYRGKGGLVTGLDGLSNKAMMDAADSDT